MSGIDVLVAAPWVAFGVVLAIVCFLLLRSNHASGRRPGLLTRLPLIRPSRCRGRFASDHHSSRRL